MKKLTGQFTEWEKIFVNHIFDKGLVSRIYEELLKLNKKKRDVTQFKNGQRIWRAIFSKDKQMISKHMKSDFSGGLMAANLLSNVGDMGSIPGPRWSHMPWGNWAQTPQLETSPLTATKTLYSQINKYFKKQTKQKTELYTLNGMDFIACKLYLNKTCFLKKPQSRKKTCSFLYLQGPTECLLSQTPVEPSCSPNI